MISKFKKNAIGICGSFYLQLFCYVRWTQTGTREQRKILPWRKTNKAVSQQMVTKHAKVGHTKELVLRQEVVKSTKDLQDIIEEIIENKVNHTFVMDNVDYSELQDYTSTDCSAVEKESQS